MDDKQIIIDGVDVSGCEFYIDSKNLEYNCKQTPQSYFCKNKPNCYYKQLKAKEQEREELKEILKEGCLHNLTLITERRVLLQTLTEIKNISEYEFKELMNAEDYHNMTEILQQILQKIKEVLNGTNP